MTSNDGSENRPWSPSAMLLPLPRGTLLSSVRWRTVAVKSSPARTRSTRRAPGTLLPFVCCRRCLEARYRDEKGNTPPVGPGRRGDGGAAAGRLAARGGRQAGRAAPQRLGERPLAAPGVGAGAPHGPRPALLPAASPPLSGQAVAE